MRFSGNCRVKTEVVCKPERERDLQAFAFQTRKAIFTGIARSGEVIHVTFKGIKMSLKFTVMVQPHVRH